MSRAIWLFWYASSAISRGAIPLRCVRCIAGALAGCGDSTANEEKGKVYFLNSKPEVVDQLQELADVYTDETGVQVIVETAASGTDTQIKSSELAKADGPTMFSLSGFDQYSRFKEYLAPVQDTEVYKLLTDEGKTYAFKDGDTAYSIPYAAEWYGIIYNKKIVSDYCAKDYAVIKSADDITDYDTFKKVVEDMQKHKDDLGIEAAFATPGLDSSGSYRFTAHMARIPLFYEYRDNNTTFMKDIKGTYLDNYKDLFDLQVKNSPTEATMLSSVTYDDVNSEFALGQVAFYTNGVWAYSGIKDNDVADEDLGMLPYFMGIDGEEDYGVGSVYDASWAVNKNASDKDKQATLDFIKWLVSDDDAKKVLSKDMGFSVPFTTFGDDDQPDNPLTVAARAWNKKGRKDIRSFTVPDQKWQDDITNALVEYVQGTGDWDTVADNFVNGWSTEWSNNEQAVGSLPEATAFDAE